MSALDVLLAIGALSLVCTYRWLRAGSGDLDVQLVPRCVRCDGLREFGHRCPDAEVSSGKS